MNQVGRLLVGGVKSKSKGGRSSAAKKGKLGGEDEVLKDGGNIPSSFEGKF